MSFRIGIGYDVHKLSEGESLWLGGINIPHDKGTVAWSDGDVLLHAICDAMLGAAKLRDIGYHFPDTADEFRNADSKRLLKESYSLVQKKGFELVNIDAVVVAQRPKLKDFIPEMEECIAKVLGVSADAVSVKATTTEFLGFEGREEGISVQAIAMIQSI